MNEQTELVLGRLYHYTKMLFDEFMEMKEIYSKFEEKNELWNQRKEYIKGSYNSLMRSTNRSLINNLVYFGKLSDAGNIELNSRKADLRDLVDQLFFDVMNNEECCQDFKDRVQLLHDEIYSHTADENDDTFEEEQAHIRKRVQ